MQPLYTSMKVNNEIELCEVSDSDCKQQIERELLKRRISYYIRWPKSSFFHRTRNNCIICINDHSKEEAESIVRNICDDMGYTVRFLFKKSQSDYL